MSRKSRAPGGRHTRREELHPPANRPPTFPLSGLPARRARRPGFTSRRTRYLTAVRRRSPYAVCFSSRTLGVWRRQRRARRGILRFTECAVRTRPTKTARAAPVSRAAVPAWNPAAFRRRCGTNCAGGEAWPGSHPLSQIRCRARKECGRPGGLIPKSGRSPGGRGLAGASHPCSPPQGLRQWLISTRIWLPG